MALTAFNRKTSGVNGVDGEKKTLTTLNRKKIAALTAFNCKNSDVNGVEPEK